ncbi:MAG: CaiB/BaiF CoA transferase family protein [Dehalococcoidia bacterium]
MEQRKDATNGMRADPAMSGRRGPLDGLRGVVLTQAWAGSFATELLALMGMEVIQIEARRRLDSWRGGYGGAIPAALRENPSAVHPWNCSPNYNAVNLNKYAMTLDLSQPEGLAIFKDLVPFADVVAENFTPRVMGNLGLDYESLARIRPDVILLSMSAYGATGPYANTPGIGGTIEPMAGMSALLGYEDGPPLNSGMMYPDPVAGYFGTAAVLTALHVRERTGKGQHIDLSMHETNMTFIADALMDYSTNRRVRPRLGNKHPTIAPHGIYRSGPLPRPLSESGVPTSTDLPSDQDGLDTGTQSPTQAPPLRASAGGGGRGEGFAWIAIAAETDEQFAGLCDVAGHPEWATDSRFGSPDDRKANEQHLDQLIEGWTWTEEAFALEDRLRNAGVPAGVVRSADEVIENDHLHQRGFLATVTHPETGTQMQAAAPWHLSRTPGGVARPAPCLGEHSREVLSRFLGITDDQYRRLEAMGITGTDPPD